MEQASASWAVDGLGPALIAFLRPCAGVDAIVVVDNVAAGPAIGGVRMRPDITAGEVARLARAVTVKNALAGLPHGGGKSGIAAPGLAAEHERVIQAFARAVGLPAVLGGVPLDELGATGFGMAAAGQMARERLDKALALRRKF